MFFFSKISIYLFLCLHEEHPSLQPSKNEHSACQNMKALTFFYFFFFFTELHGVGHHQQSWAKNIFNFLIQNIQRYNTTSKVRLGIRQLFSILVGHFALLDPDPGPHY